MIAILAYGNIVRHGNAGGAADFPWWLLVGAIVLAELARLAWRWWPIFRAAWKAAK